MKVYYVYWTTPFDSKRISPLYSNPDKALDWAEDYGCLEDVKDDSNQEYVIKSEDVIGDENENTRIINSSNYVHLPEHSRYNNNYYRNIETNDIIFEEVGASEEYGSYYNLGKRPTFTDEDLKTAEFLGYSHPNMGFVGIHGDNIFEVNVEFT